MATAVSGTGPTYVFLVMEALIDAAVHLGFPRHMAHDLVIETLEGSTLFAKSSGMHPAQLRNMVTSPGGTSAAALHELESGRLRTVLSEAVWAAYRRTDELGRKLEAERRNGPRRAATIIAQCASSCWPRLTARTLSGPSRSRARRLRNVQGNGHEPEILRVYVSDLETAAGLGFHGSPTLRIDGRDVVPPPPELPINLGCRLYPQPSGRLDGVIPAETIRRRD